LAQGAASLLLIGKAGTVVLQAVRVRSSCTSVCAGSDDL